MAPVLSSSTTLLVWLVSFFLALHVCSGGPTTPYIQQVFTGKCLNRNPQKSGEQYCLDLWDTFSAGAMQDMGVVTDKDFDPFFTFASFSTTPDNALFWSGTKDFASKLSADGTYFTTLEETATGYIINGLTWCGSAYQQGVPPSFDYEGPCDFMQNSSYYGDQGVWVRCSRIFAQSAVGQVNVLLQPQRLYYTSGPYIAFRNTSIFYTTELQNMNTQTVTSMRILLIVDLDNAPTETCGNGSLALLRDTVYKKFGFFPQCIDDPEEILNILCEQQDGTSPECAVASRCKDTPPQQAREGAHTAAAANNNKGLIAWAVAGSCLSALLLAIVAVLAANVYHMKRQYRPIE